MNGQMDLVTLIVIVVAVVVILRLRSVLGRRTGDEEARLERYRAQQRGEAQAGPSQSDRVVPLPRRDDGPPASTPASASEAELRLKTFAGGDEAVARGLADIYRSDSAFDPEHFLKGARVAYEMIVTAFADGNRDLLQEYLSPDVYEGFEEAIAERESRGERIEQRFVGIEKADLQAAEVKSGIANVTVRFLSQLISATRDRAGTLISGDPHAIVEVTDIWTFCRDISTARARSNPNWRLAETQSAA